MDTRFAKRLMACLLVVGLVLGSLPAARAADADPETTEGDGEAAGPTPLRLAFTTGDVRFWRPGTDGWVPAQVNLPLAPGDQLATDHLGNIEIQTGPQAFLRLWGDSRLALVGHDDDALRLGVTSGYLGLDLRSVAGGTRIHVDTPHAAIALGQAGYYRIDVSADRTSVIARRGGRATVTSDGRTASVASDQQVLARAASAGSLESTTAPAADAWDRWSTQRTDTLLAAQSLRYVAPELYGAADLDRHGTWREEPTYGRLWAPADIPAGWAPYSTGTWISDPVYGWTWVDAAPWGWAPYHYGRWVFVNGGWAWAPGPRVARAVYAPALVAFFGPPEPVDRPFVSWVALGWGEPVVPWWGRPGFVGRPWYAGWAGPRHWHRDHFHGRPFDYRNVRVRNAVVGMHRDRFGRERVERARLAALDASRLQPVRDPRPDRETAARDRGRPGIDDRTGRRPGSEPDGRGRPSARPERDTEPERRRDGPHGRSDRETVAQPEQPRERASGRPDRDTVTEPERPRERASGRPDRETAAQPERARDRASERQQRESAVELLQRPRERATVAPGLSDGDMGEQSRLPAIRPRADSDRPRAPDVGPSPRHMPSPQQRWQRTGDHGQGSVHRERSAPASGRRESPSRGRR